MQHNIATQQTLQPSKRLALPKGTKVDYCGMLAVVVADQGGDSLTVLCEDHVQRWYWCFEGVECTVLEPDTAQVA